MVRWQSHLQRNGGHRGSTTEAAAPVVRRGTRLPCAVRPQSCECGSLDSQGPQHRVWCLGARRGQRSPGVQDCGAFIQAWLVGLPTGRGLIGKELESPVSLLLSQAGPPRPLLQMQTLRPRRAKGVARFMYLSRLGLGPRGASRPSSTCPRTHGDHRGVRAGDGLSGEP